MHDPIPSSPADLRPTVAMWTPGKLDEILAYLRRQMEAAIANGWDVSVECKYHYNPDRLEPGKVKESTDGVRFLIAMAKDPLLTKYGW